MSQTNTLSKKQTRILYIIAGICAAVALIVTIGSIVRAFNSPDTPQTDREKLVYYNWSNTQKLTYWDFSEGHLIRVYVRENTDDPFELGMVINYALNEQHKKIQISQYESMAEASYYDYELTEKYLYLYNQEYQEEGKKPLPTVILQRTEEWLE